WRVEFGGISTPGLADRDGMLYIARLLQTPNLPVDVLDLWVLAHPGDSEQIAALKRADQLDMPVPTSGREGRRRIERHIRDLKGDIDASEQEPGNPEKKAIADEARLALAKLGKLTKERRSHQNTQRKGTLDCVKKAIDLARTQIAEFNKPLADHLSSPTIKTGYNCVYHPPDPAPQWVVILP
ncbi:MAG TPA: hypothetical protein VM425_10690, partial [Myxococcota bacterium]|nr:hypothetical protein [Myxococcota bacterium]